MKLLNVTKNLSRALTLVAALALASAAVAQTTFVISNGDAAKRHHAYYGDKLLAINSTWTGVEMVSQDQFSPRCVWHRTAKTGYYYQEGPDGTIYYLHRDGNDLDLVAVPAGSLLSSTTLWYDWTFGVAVQELTNGGGSYFWIVTNDADNPTGWTMSVETYGRPGFDASMGTNGYGYGNNSAMTYDEATPGSMQYGQYRAATFNRTVVTEVPTTPVEGTTPTGGLTAAALTASSNGILTHNGNDLTVSALGITALSSQTTPAYTLYDVQNVNNYRDDYYNYSDYDDETYFTYTTARQYFWYQDAGEDAASIHAEAPASEAAASTKTVVRYEWVLSGQGARYLEVSPATVENPAAGAQPQATVTVSADYAAAVDAKLTLVAHYSDGYTQSLSTTLHLIKSQAPTAVAVADIEVTRGKQATAVATLTPATAYASLQVSGQPTGMTVTTSGATLTLNAATAAPGVYTLTAKALDESGLPAETTIDNEGTTETVEVSTTFTVTVYPEAPDGVSVVDNGTSPATLNGFTLNNNTIGYDIYYKTGSPIAADAELSTLTLFSSAVTLQPNVPLYAISVQTVGEGESAQQLRSQTVYSYLPTISSGVQTTADASGIMAVVLNDLEDHSWSYYSDPDCPIHSLNPADVKITYYGNGQGNAYNMTDETGSSIQNFKATATGVKVNIGGEDQNTFVYYKTLERVGGDAATSVSASTGRCAYTTIPNPFQVRPTQGTDDSRWRGFYKWAIKDIKNGKIYTAATGGTEKSKYTEPTTAQNIQIAAGSTLDAEATYYFEPDGEYGMEVELVALWAPAIVVTTNNTSSLGTVSNGYTYERNFMVMPSSNTSAPAQASDKAYTVSSFYPNGTTNGTTAATASSPKRSMSSSFTLRGSLKIENINVTGSSAMTANGTVNNTKSYNKDLVLGRGVTMTNSSKPSIIGQTEWNNNTSSVGALKYTLRIESGQLVQLHLANGNMGSGITTISARCILGSDYDRAKNDDSKLSIVPTYSTSTVGYGIYGGSSFAPSSSANRNNLSFDWVVKSGTFNDTDHIGAAEGGNQSIYIGTSGDNSSTSVYTGKRRMLVEGGTMCSIAGGMNSGNASNNVSEGNAVEIVVKGGTILGSIYGAASEARANGTRMFKIMGGSIGGWIAGGCNGTETKNGQLYGDTYIYVGGNAQCNSNGSTTTIGPGEAQGGNIFGAGSGNSGASGDNATVGQVNNSTIVIADNAFVERNVYGGGNYGFVSSGTGHKSDVYLLGGTVGGGVFGGSNNQKGQIVNITMKGGTVKGGVFGGSNSKGTVAGPVNINIMGGQVGTDMSVTATVNGGGYGASTHVTNNVNIVIGEDGTTGPTIYGDVYGGSAMGDVNGTAYSSAKKTTVTVNSGTILGQGTTATTGITGTTTIGQVFQTTGSVYGGGLGTSSNAAHVYGNVEVVVNGGTMNNVFGCNNVNGMPYGTVSTTINGGTIVESVYGGGNAAPYGTETTNATPTVKMTGGTVKGNVYGGGLGRDAVVSKDTQVTVENGTVEGNVYGGGSAANVTGKTEVIIGK